MKKCTNYFKGIDGLGNCDKRCQWWVEPECPWIEEEKWKQL